MDDAPLASFSLTHVRYVSRNSVSASCGTTELRNITGVTTTLMRPETYLQLLTSLQNPADRISIISAWLALVPQALCIIYVTLIWSTREIEVILMFAGQMACELLNFGLKRWIREERPQRKLTINCFAISGCR